MNESILDRFVVVLDQPKDVVNIAAVMRAMLNMGLSRLRLVRPDDFDPWRIEGIAHRSAPLIEATVITDTLLEAVGDCTFVVGTSARARTANRNYAHPRPLAGQLLARAAEGQVALVFGREDRGLTNEALDLCHQVAIIPTHADYSSLNLAQALLIFAHEIRMAATGGGEALPTGRRADRPATLAELESMYDALEAGLDRINFFKGTRRAPAVVRVLRTVFARAGLDRRESRLIRAIGLEIQHYLDRQSEPPTPAAGDPTGPGGVP